jgi:hypothetical protein
MQNDLNQAFWNLSMSLCDLAFEGPSDFATLSALKTLADFRAVAFPTHFGALVGHWLGLTEKFTATSGLPQLRIERPQDLLRREAIVMTGHWQPLAPRRLLFSMAVTNAIR